jgi:hypothetical protein
MLKLALVACLIITQTASAQSSLELRSYVSDGITKNVLYLNERPFTGNRTSLLVKETVKPGQPLNMRYAVLHKDVPVGTSQFRDPYTLFIKDKQGHWEETITVFNTIPKITDDGNDILVTISGGGNEQEGTFILRSFIFDRKVKWLLLKN